MLNSGQILQVLSALNSGQTLGTLPGIPKWRVGLVAMKFAQKFGDLGHVIVSSHAAQERLIIQETKKNGDPGKHPTYGDHDGDQSI